MKKLILLLSFALCCLNSNNCFAQQEEYAFIDIDFRPKKITVYVTKDGSSTKSEVQRPDGDISIRTEIIKFMNDLNKEGYQLFSMSPAVFVYTGASSLNESYIFVRKK